MTSFLQPDSGALWRDVRLAVGAFLVAAVVIGGVGALTSYVSGVFFLIVVAWLAWYSGFRAGLVATLLSTAAIWPLIRAFDAQAASVNFWVRSASIAVVGLVVSWLCGNLHTARRRLLVEQALLRDSEQFHRLIGEMATDFAFRARVDETRRFVLDAATTGLQTMLGYSPAEIRTLPWRNVFDPADQASVKADFERVLSGRDVLGSARVEGKGGKQAIVEYRLHPARDASGKVTGVIGAVRERPPRPRRQQRRQRPRRQRRRRRP